MSNLELRRQLTVALASNSGIFTIFTVPNVNGLVSYTGDEPIDQNDISELARISQKAIAIYVDQLVDQMIEIGELEEN